MLHCQNLLEKNNTSTGQESLKLLLNVYINFHESIICATSKICIHTIGFKIGFKLSYFWDMQLILILASNRPIIVWIE